ncbi:MAG: LysR family transcriptional regulator [Proteobacteria bacterium]|nr:LysR family transcriptional regulator [Pseudomonadota bacterium]
MKAFLLVASEKNFSRAAEKLFRTQPAVSQSIRLLEEDLGERLFLRMGRTAVLTQAGRILQETATHAFEILEQGRIRIEALKELREGELTLSASDTTSCFVLPEVLQQFRTRYPGVEVRILNCPSPNAVKQVVEHESDIGIVTLPIEHPKLTSEPIVVREDVAICSPSHPLAKQDKANFNDLLAYPLLLLDRGSNTRSFIDERLSETKMESNITMELGSIEVIKKLVQMDFGVSIVPRIAVQEEIRRNTLRAVRIFDKDECRRLGVIYHAKGVLPLAAQVFVRMLKETISPKNIL